MLDLVVLRNIVYRVRYLVISSSNRFIMIIQLLIMVFCNNLTADQKVDQMNVNRVNKFDKVGGKTVNGEVSR
jgi:hypothetical protein